MRRPFSSLAVILGLAGTPGCLGSPLVPGQQVAGRLTVSGVVMAPAYTLPVTLGNSTVEPDTLSPVPGASVILADGRGKPVPGAVAVLTDALGHYTLPDVPIGRTHQIVATFKDGQNKDVTLRALTVPDPANTTAHLNPAATAVTDALLAGNPDALGPMDRSTYQLAVTLTQTMMAQQGTPSLTDRDALRVNVARLAGRHPELATQMDGLSRSLLGGKAFGTAVGPVLIDTYKASTATPFYVSFVGGYGSGGVDPRMLAGDSVAEDYVGWIQGYDLLWNGDLPSTGTIPGAMPEPGGRPVFGSLSFTKHVDATMPFLFDAMGRGTNFPVVTIVQTVTVGDKIAELRKLTLGDAYITGITLSDRSNGALPMEEVRIGFSSLRLREAVIDPQKRTISGNREITYNLATGRPRLPDDSKI